MYKCKICNKKFNELTDLHNHVATKHKDMIPKDMTVQQYCYYMKTGRLNGNCVMCKQPTDWNKNTNKYNRFCNNPKCKDEYVKIVKGRMVSKYGKVHLLDDPKKQREMLANRKISGTYEWSDGKTKTTYTGSYELDFLKTLDLFLEWDPSDIMMPSPHNYTYSYEGDQKFYIPDAFIPSLDLEIEIKDGGDNPNNHHKIQEVDKEKERLKDDVMTTQKMFHYIKLTNKNYTNFFDFLKEYKLGFEKFGDEKKVPRIFKIEDIKTKAPVKPIQESYEYINESIVFSGDDLYINYEDFKEGKSNLLFITGLSGSGKSTLGRKLAKEHNAEYVELDLLCEANDPKRIRGTVFEEFVNKFGLDNFDVHNEELFFEFVSDFLNWVVAEKFNRRLVIEGIQVFCVGHPEVMKQYPVIIKNTSMLKSMSRAWKRDFDNWKDFIRYAPQQISWYIDDEIKFRQFKKAMVKESTEEILEENIIFSKDNIELNLDKYNKENNILYITGLGGSGKSTIISQYAEKYNAEALEFDAITSALIKGLENLNRSKIHPIIIEYLETQNPNKLNGFSDENFNVECVKFLDWFEDKVQGNGNMYVIEGMQIFLCFEPQRFVGKPMIIMGTSVTKSMYRSVSRNYKRNGGDIVKTFKFFLKTLKRGKIFIQNDIQLTNLINTLNESMEINNFDEIVEENFIDTFVAQYNRRKKGLRYNSDIVEPIFNANLEHPEDLQKYMTKLITMSKTQDDIEYVERLGRKSKDKYERLMKEYPNEDPYKAYYNWLMKGGMEKQINKQMKDEKINIVPCTQMPLREEFEPVEEKFNLDKALVWFEKPIEKLTGKNIKVYRGSSVKLDDVIEPKSINVGSTRYSNPRWSTYFWDNKEDAIRWEATSVLEDMYDQVIYMGHEGKTLLGKPNNVSDKEFIKSFIEKSPVFYVYEADININDLEMGSGDMIREYVVSKPVKITKRYEYKLNKELMRRCFTIVDISVTEKMKAEIRKDPLKRFGNHRNPIVSNILDNRRDSYRAVIRTDLQQGNIKIGDDLSSYRKSINYNLDNNTYGLRESSISLDYINQCLQNEYDEELKKYLNDYKTFYNKMQKERPDAVPHINEDIKRAIIYIDGLANKGVSNDLVQYARQDLGDIVDIPKNNKKLKHSKYTQSLVECLIVKINYEDKNRSLFSMTDTKTMISINDEYVIQKPKAGINCLLSPITESIETSNSLQFIVKFDKGVDLDLIQEKMETGLQINSLLKLNDDQNKVNFINEVCIKLFGVTPIDVYEEV